MVVYLRMVIQLGSPSTALLFMGAKWVRRNFLDHSGSASPKPEGLHLAALAAEELLAAAAEEPRLRRPELHPWAVPQVSRVHSSLPIEIILKWREGAQK